MRQLGGYTLTHRLGVGGMGEVWKGRRRALGGAGVDVAVKILTASKADDPEARRMFLDEARLSMLLTSSNIVKVFDADESADGTCYMVMEWVDGLNLAELSEALSERGERLPDPIIAYVVGEVLKGLAHAHDRRHGSERITIVHRDVSPHNVMLSTTGEVKVMDFGIARVASEETSGVHVKGKLRYMPPEQLRGETREPTLDLFAVGAILHELLDGHKFRSKVLDEARLYGMILDGEVPAMTRREPVPPALDELRLSLLAARPEHRVQSAREAFTRLTCWAGYRDARFGFDEIVQCEVESRSSPSVDELSLARSGSAPAHDPSSPARGAPAPVHVASSSVVSEPFQANTARSTTVFHPEGSETDLGARPTPESSGSHTSVQRSGPPRVVPRRVKEALALGIAGLGVGAVGLITVAVFGAWGGRGERGEPDGAPVTAGAGDPEVQDEPAVEAEPAVEPAKSDLAAEDPPEAPAESEALEAPEAPGPSEASVESKQVEAPAESERRRPKRLRVTVSLGGGVPWARIKLGRRVFELDSFSNRQASTRLPAGRYRVDYQTKVGSTWHQGEQVTISKDKTRVVLRPGGKVTVE